MGTDKTQRHVEMQVGDKLESASSLDSEQPLQENVQPMSLKPEEIEESVGVEEKNKFESTSNLDDKKPEKKNKNQTD